MSHRDVLKTARRRVFDEMSYCASIEVSTNFHLDTKVKWNRFQIAVGSLGSGYGEYLESKDQLVFWLDGLPSTIGFRGQIVTIDGGEQFQLLECQSRDEFTQTWEANRL